MTRYIVLILFCLSALNSLFADDEVFARQGDQILTHAEIDAAFMRVPAKYRLPFIRDGERVDQLVSSLLRYKIVAAEAQQNGFDQDPLVAERMQLAMEQELAEAWIAQVVETAPPGDYESLAYERYLANPEKYRSQESLDVSHILIKSDIRPEEEALASVNRLHAELIENPALFDEYIEEYSEDPAKKTNAGRYPDMTRGKMVKPFEEAAFAMSGDGSISEPVKTSYGYHIIRLNGRTPSGTKPFEQVKGILVQQSIDEHKQKVQRDYLMKLSEEPIELPDGAVEKMVKRHFGENLEKAPGFYDQ
jgi:peptidyl-prolyl cis-trans isomerase C